jgi:hypothetical protein
MRKDNKNAHHHRARHGTHQKRNHKFLKVYTPYLPLIIFVSLSLVLSFYPRSNTKIARLPSNDTSSSVLAYATGISVDGLLGATNQKRNDNGVASLAFNSKLMNAAQAKANDMVTRNYWSHNTPDGSPPWVFITNAGYSYSGAGENLAYGQQTSAQVISDWYGSPSHKDNLLNNFYTEVGFGVANSADFIGDPNDKEGGYPYVGNQTIIVAMYAKPYSAPVAPKSTTPAIKPAETKNATPTVQPTPTTQPTPSQETTVTNSTDKEKPSGAANTTINEDPTLPVVSGSSKNVNRIESLTKSTIPWLTTVLIIFSVSGGLIVLGKHGLAFQKLILKGERYVLQHTLFDVTVISMVMFTYIATRSAGVIL